MNLSTGDGEAENAFASQSAPINRIVLFLIIYGYWLNHASTFLVEHRIWKFGGEANR
jgi:hypothetical protein